MKCKKLSGSNSLFRDIFKASNHLLKSEISCIMTTGRKYYDIGWYYSAYLSKKTETKIYRKTDGDRKDESDTTTPVVGK